MKVSICLLAVALANSLALAQDESIVWSSIDAGGGVSSGGPYTMLATIGQSDAGVSASGPFTLSGGFMAGFVQPCRVDLDGDGLLTVFDFLALQNEFGAGSPVADFDGDGQLTIFDFLVFQNAFDRGC
ncbi:MAG: GC-type dockerin domain-anchored protein [Phycisphaerales bacterium]